MIRRREFITLLGGAAATWPLGARAQQGERMRRIGVLMGADENDPVGKVRLSAVTQAFADLGWTVGRNVQMHDVNRTRPFAQELVGLQPDIILTNTTPATVAVQRADDPDRLCGRERPRRPAHRRAAGPPEWEHHRFRQLGSHAGRQVA
jgi:putative ABC transport system substrate-binding protein